VIVAVCSDKGSPGATTLAFLLGLHWPGERVVVELDPRGADLPYRAAGAGMQPLAASPTVTTLAVDSRPGGTCRSLLVYSQATAAGVPLIAGESSATRFGRLGSQLPAIGDALADWPGTVVADLGSLQPGNPTLSIARRATVCILVARADTAGLGHLRERVEELAAELGGPHRLRSPLAVVVRAEARDAGAAHNRVRKLLDSIGSPVPVLAGLPEDASTVRAVMNGTLTKRITRSPLMRSSRDLVAAIRATWPELTEPVSSRPVPDPQVASGAGR
jgi:hypothetical protein